MPLKRGGCEVQGPADPACPSTDPALALGAAVLAAVGAVPTPAAGRNNRRSDGAKLTLHGPQGRGKVKIVGLTRGDPEQRPRPAGVASAAARTCRLKRCPPAQVGATRRFVRRRDDRVGRRAAASFW